MSTRFIAIIVFLSTLSSGCIGHYRYESQGNVLIASGQQTEALLYWYGDEGRLWYGPRYKQTDTDIDMIVCDMTPKSFEPAGADNDELQLLSRSGDSQVVAVNNSGEIVPLSEPKRLSVGSECGRLSVSQATVSTNDLHSGTEPNVIILCFNAQRPDRYPEAGRYEFRPIARIKVDGNEEPTNFCHDVQN